MASDNHERSTGLGEASLNFVHEKQQEPDEAALSIPGVAHTPPGDREERGLTRRYRQEIRLDLRRDSDQLVALDFSPDDIIEIETEDDVKIWLRAHEFDALMRPEAKRDGAAVVATPRLPMRDPATRGIVDWGIKLLRVIDVDVAGEAAKGIATHIEGKNELAPGLYRFDLQEPVPAGPLEAGGQPWLIFLHGTFSSGMGSFGELKKNEPWWKALKNSYDDRILSLEHRSVTESPIENARDLMRLLPEGAELHLVSHSRGGLIGELLCRATLKAYPSGDARAPFTSDEIKLFAGRAEQLTALQELGELLEAKRPRVTRFVRVACPARGTSLAGGRLDSWLNLMFNVIGIAADRVPVVGDVLEGIEDLTLAIAAKRTDPDVLPGLEAMMPGSPFIKVMNWGGVTSDADLRVIEGDIDASGVLHRLAIWFTDLYYGGDHDLVVDTSSMTGGLPRSGARWAYREDGPKVDHFSYFTERADSNSVARIATALAEAEPAGFRKLPAPASGPESPRIVQLDRSNERPELPVVFVLPGLAGSHLDVDDDWTWLNPLRLPFGVVGQLGIDEIDVEPRGIFDTYYGDLCRALQHDHNVIPWAYDWRRSILDTAALFARELKQALDTSEERPVRIVAHSMGGLVARQALATPGVGTEFERRAGCRLVMLGTPNKGSWSIGSMLTAQDSLIPSLAAADLTATTPELLAVVGRFPGIMELLPHGEDRAYEPGFWQRFHDELPREQALWPQPESDMLAVARRFADQFNDAPVMPDRMYYIAGSAKTVTDIRINSRAKRIDYVHTSEGDGRVLWADGIPPGVRAWYMNVDHGTLPQARAGFEAIRDLLTEGRTSRLPDRPAIDRSAVPILEMRGRAPLSVFPDGESLDRAVFGTAPSRRRETTSQLLRISILNGDLSYANCPILVGHYIGDSIAGTEGVLDSKLNGKLDVRRRLGLYPGAVGTHQIVLTADDKSRSGGVTGLGREAELTAGALSRAFAHGLVALNLAIDEQAAWSEENGRKIASVLIGSGEGGLDMATCATALLRGAREAQRQLKTAGVSELAELQLVELSQSRAIQAWREIKRIQENAEFDGLIALTAEIETCDGVDLDIPVLGDETWWQPLQIVEKKEFGKRWLHFTAITGKARSEQRMVPDNWRFAEEIVNQAISYRGTSTGDASPGRALFEMLWPNALKAHSADNRNIRLQLDRAAARIPWELLDDRRSGHDGGRGASEMPPAVRVGVIRQLLRDPTSQAHRPPTDERCALVIGDPQPQDPELRSGFARLPGAIEEAQQVAAQLEGAGYEVVRLIDRGWDNAGIEPATVAKYLFSRPWKIIHIAAHGVVNYRFKDCETEWTGVVLGKDSVLSTSLLEQLPFAPTLAFVNCCHLAKIDSIAEATHLRQQRPELAASIALQLIEMGTDAVVAAGWAVDDRSAKTFAHSLYNELLINRRNLGDAATEARRAAYLEAQGRNNSWGAYQVYGDPRRPVFAQSSNRGDWHEPQFAGPDEMRLRAQTLTNKAHVALGRKTEALCKSARQLTEQAQERQWLSSDAALATALATLHKDLGLWREAIRLYKLAAANKKATLPVAALEQLHNLQIRLACREALADPSKASDAQKQIEAAREKIKILIELTDDGSENRPKGSSERLSLIASSYKREAMITTGNARRNALEAMTDAYEQARLAGGLTSEMYEEVYADTNLLTAAIIEALQFKDAEARWAAIEARCDKARKEDNDRYDFWAGDRRIMNDLCYMMAKEKSSFGFEQARAIIEEYQDLKARCGSDHKLASVIDQYEFLTAVLRFDDDSDRDKLPIRAAVLPELERILTALHAMSPQRHDQAK